MKRKKMTFKDLNTVVLSKGTLRNLLPSMEYHKMLCRDTDRNYSINTEWEAPPPEKPLPPLLGDARVQIGAKLALDVRPWCGCSTYAKYAIVRKRTNPRAKDNCMFLTIEYVVTTPGRTLESNTWIEKTEMVPHWDQLSGEKDKVIVHPKYDLTLKERHQGARISLFDKSEPLLCSVDNRGD